MVFPPPQSVRPINISPNHFPAQNFNQSHLSNLPGNAPQGKISLSNLANKGIGGLSKTLTNVQQVLKVVESTAPLIEQYGPMVKNLPAIFKMIKSLKEFEDMDEEAEGSDLFESSTFNNEELSSDWSESFLNNEEEESISIGDDEENIKEKSNGQSIPKLFI
ncbi:MAG TPA: VrrA/YqfQ family protein [Candidatus Avamphibacillus sp.]|nr:VrrA/YqfQ family protein [Candidatus Avamphibacillus sp.]